MASCRASSTIEYFSSEIIAQGVFVNMIASMNCFASSKIAFWCWGTLWTPPAFGWGTLWSPPALESGSIWAGTMSDLRNMLMVNFWRLSNGGAMAPAGCHRFGSEVRVMTVSARFRFFGRGTSVVHIILSRRAWSRCRTSSWMSKLSSSISEDKVDYPASSLSSSLISSWSVWSSSWFIWIRARTFSYL